MLSFRRFIRRFLPSLVLLLSLTSCGYKEVTVRHYKIANCREYVNLRTEPRSSARVVDRVYLDSEVVVLESVHEPPDWEYWSKIRVKSSGKVGYVKDRYLHSWTTEERVYPPTMSERLEKAGQKVTPRIFKFIEDIPSVVGRKLYVVADRFDGRDDGHWLRMLLVLFAIAFSLGLGAAIKFCETIQWWHYLIAMVFIPVELIALGCALPGNVSFDTGIFIIDIILNLIAFALVLSVPSVHWYSSTALIGNMVGSKDGGETYIVFTMLFLFVFVVGARLFPSAGDIFFYIYLGLIGLMFVFMNIAKVGLCRISFEPRLFFRLRGLYVFFLRIIISVLYFVLLLGFTMYMIVPLVAVSLAVGVLMFCGLIIVFVLLSPMGMNTISSKYSTDLVDGAGRFVDSIDSAGWSSGGGGRHYSRGFDGLFHRDH